MVNRSTVHKILFSFILLSVIFCTISISTAAEPAGYYFESNGIMQFRYGEIPNMSYLHNHMYYTNLMSETNKDSQPTYLLKNTDGSFTFVNVTQFSNAYDGSIVMENVTIFFNGSESGGFLPGNWRMSNSTIISTSNPVNFQAERLGNYDMHNITFKNINSFTLNAQSNFQPYSGNITNISIYNSKNGLLLKHIEPVGHIKNLYFENMERQSFLLEDASFYEVSNVTIENGGDYQNPKTYVGFLIAGGHDNTARNIYVNGSPWSGVDLTSNEYNTTLENIYVNHAGHNGVDFHGQWNCSINNVTVNGSVAENFMITGRDDMYQPSYEVVDWTNSNSNRVTHTIKITNYTSYNSTGAALSANRYIGLEVVNMTSMNNGGGFLINYAMDTLIKNAEIYDLEGKPALTLGGIGRGAVYNTRVIDSYFSGYAWFLGAVNTRILNTIIPSFSISGDTDYSNAYYADFMVIDSLGNPIPNSAIEFSSSHLNFESMNSLCEDKSIFVTSSKGRTQLPFQNRSNSPALIEYHKDIIEKVNLVFSYESIVTDSSGNSIILSDITPDSSWYREDPNTPTYTITAIIPDNNTTGPHIKGFAPSEDNPYTAGETKKFRVWADEELTTMKWYVNGNLRSGGSMEYNWEVEEGSHTIMFTGSNENGSVVQTWEITEGVPAPVEEPSEDPVLPSDGTTYTPSATSFVADIGDSITFSISTDQPLMSLDWYVDGEIVESGVMEYTHEWSAAGIHSVRLEGDAGTETISNTWSVVVSEAGSSTISVLPSSAVVAPGDTFSLDVNIDPATSLSGSQFDMHYSSIASVDSVHEGELFSGSGLSTTFYSGDIDDFASVLSGVYSAIVSSGTISAPGTMATVNMVAGSSTGVLELALSDVVLSDANSNPAPYKVSNATVLVDSAPVFDHVDPVSAVEGDVILLPVSATDPDGDSLSYSCTSLPDGASFNPTTAIMSWTPEDGDAGDYSAVFEVTDGYLNDSVSVTISVTDIHPRWDINEDGDVNASDIVLVRQNFGNKYSDDLPRWDVNQDGIVNIQDVSIVASRFESIE